MKRHLERIEWRPRREIDRSEWPYSIPAVAQLIDEGGFEVPAGVTILVGENGSGKSTLVEAFAQVYPRHGAESSSPISVTGPGASEEDSPLHWHLKARTAAGWEELELTRSWKGFLDAPQRWLKHLLG